MTRTIRLAISTALCAITSLAVAQTPPPSDLALQAAPAAPVATPLTVPKLRVVHDNWSAEAYGFVELDAMHDSTQSFSDVPGNSLIARPGTFQGSHDRFLMGVRNSRLGLKLAAPDFHQVKASAVFEMDFLGNQATNATEAQYFLNPAFRIRHGYLKLETPIVDILAGQSWDLFGWQSGFDPNTVAIQGLPGQVYSRTLQFRLSHKFKTDAVEFELAGALARAPQKDSGTPDGQFGAKLSINHWTGLHTVGSTGTASDAASIGVSGVVRQFRVPGIHADNLSEVDSAIGWGLSVDAMIPIIPATTERRANALTLTGSFTTGKGIADLYTSLTGGFAMPATIPGTNPAPKSDTPYASNVDNGLVAFDATGQLSPIEWQSFIVGVQYYLPPWGNVWVSANYSQMGSDNAVAIARGGNPTDLVNAESKILQKSQWADANLFWDVVPAVRLGFEYAWFNQIYGDGTETHNNRYQLSAFFIF